MSPPPPLKPDSASQANLQPLSALGDSCSSPILEPDRSALLQEALADPQLQAVKAQLERRGFSINTDEAQAVQLAGGQQVLIPFGENAHLVWTRTNGQTAAVGLIRQGNKTLNISPTGEERVVRFLPQQKVEKLLRKLREKPKFQEFEGKLHQKGKRVGKIRALFDETNQIAILGIASEGDEEKIVHQVRITLKAYKDDEPEDDAEPAIQATACGQATGEAVPEGARMHAQMYDAGEGGDVVGSSYDVSEGRDYGTNICISQWGYAYNCIATAPSVSLSPTGLTFPQTFINQQTQASFTIWNGGGGRLTGTISAPAPFSIVSGGSFSLLPGQPQQVTVRFSSATGGSFSQNLTITSNAGTKLMPVSGVAHKVTFSPATVNFGEGMFVVTEQCGGETGECLPYTKKVGLPVQGKLVVKNEGSVAVSLNLSTSAPFSLVSGGALTLAAGQSAEVGVRFDPADSGSFTGTITATLQNGQGSLTSGPLTGIAHKITVSPTALNFFALVEGPAIQQTLTITNQGITTPALTVTTNEPFSVDVSSFTLAAGGSKDVTVQFSPTTGGEFSSTISIRLSQMQAAFSVPLQGKSITETEFFQWLSEMSQAGPIDAVIPADEVSVVLRHFRDLSPTDIQALISLAKTEDWGSLLPIGSVELEQIDDPLGIGQKVLEWILGKIYEYLKSLNQQGPTFNALYQQFTDLANQLALPNYGTQAFITMYTSLTSEQFGDPNFRQFVNLLRDIIARLGATSLFPTETIGSQTLPSEGVVIKEFVKLFNNTNYNPLGLRTLVQHLGHAAVFALAAMAKIDLNVANGSGVTAEVLNGFAIIVLTQAGTPWYPEPHKDNTLWRSLAAALLLLGEAAAKPGDQELQGKFNATITALGVAATLANQNFKPDGNDWAILAFRVQGVYAHPTTIDVIAGTQINDTKVVIFGQFFHAVTGFDRTQMEELLRAVAMVAKGEQGGINFLTSIFPSAGPGNDKAFQYIRSAQLFGVIIAVKAADKDQATQAVDGILSSEVLAGTKNLFVIIIAVNDDKIVTDIIIRGNVDEQIVKQILDQMNIAINRKLPGSPRLLMRLLMMLLGFVQ